MDLDDRGTVERRCARLPQPVWMAQALGPAGSSHQDVFLVAQSGGCQEGPSLRPGRTDGQIVVSGGQSFEALLGVAEGDAEAEALSVLAGQRAQSGKHPLRGELRRPREMQRP